MKKIKYLMALVIGAMLLTGCVKFNATMDIKKDKSMDFSIIYALDKTAFGESAKLEEKDFEEVKKEGFTVTKYSEGNFEGFTLSKKISNIDEVSSEKDAEYDLSGLMNSNSENKYIFKVVKGNNKNTYYAKFKFNANDSGLNNDDTNLTTDENLPDESTDLTGENSLDNIDLSGMMANLDLSFNVKLPESALSSNATNKDNDNKNLTWKLNASGEEFIEFSFELPNGSGFNMLYVGIGGAILVIIALVMVLLSRKNNNGKPIVNNDTHTEIQNDVNENVHSEEVPLKKPEVVNNEMSK